MQPIPITQDMANSVPKASLVEFKAPEGTENEVGDVMALIEIGIPDRIGPDRVYIPLRPSDEEIEAILRGEPIWFAFWGHRIPVFQAYVQPVPGEYTIRLSGGPYDGRFLHADEIGEGIELVSFELMADWATVPAGKTVVYQKVTDVEYLYVGAQDEAVRELDQETPDEG